MSLLVALGLLAVGITVIFTLYNLLHVDDLEGVLAGDYDVKPEATNLPQKVYVSKRSGNIMITDLVTAQFQSVSSVVVNPILNVEDFKNYLENDFVELGEL